MKVSELHYVYKKKCIKASSENSNDALNIILQENKALREQLLKEGKKSFYINNYQKRMIYL